MGFLSPHVAHIAKACCLKPATLWCTSELDKTLRGLYIHAERPLNS